MTIAAIYKYLGPGHTMEFLWGKGEWSALLFVALLTLPFIVEPTRATVTPPTLQISSSSTCIPTTRPRASTL